MIDEIGDLRLFIRMVGAGSLSETARHLNSSLPAMSRRLSQMEERLGVRLIDRGSRHFLLTDEGMLLYEDPRQFGRIEWGDARVQRLGPEPLEVGLAEFSARLRKRKTRIKALLLNQSFIAGLGNIYVDEILFLSEIHPLAQAARLSAPRVAKMHQAMVDTLTLAIEHRGSSISDYVDADGNRGNFQMLHRVYGREGEACVTCGAAIKKAIVAGRGTHYCPVCQKR